jgi:protein involved in polysaccharide export with SLBB domain
MTPRSRFRTLPTGLIELRFERLFRSLALLCLGLVSFLLAAPAATAQGATEGTLRPGDVVRIDVWQKPELSGEFRVGIDGALVHPLYRAVQVAGVPMQEAESRVIQFLAQYEGPTRISFQPLFQVFVGGEVLDPGVRGLPMGTTMAQALAGAGGYTREAATNRVILVRDGQEIRADLRDPADPVLTQPVRSGDQILVPTRRQFVRDLLVPISSVTGAALAILSFLVR